MFTSIRTRIAATVLTATGAAALLVGGTAGPAAAAPGGVYPLHNCINLSPNIVDLPYNPSRVIVSQYRDRTYLAIDYTSVWIGAGYDSVARIDWHNLNTHKRGVIVGRNHVSPPYQGTHQVDVPTASIGRGKVALRLTTTNRNALWAVPARTCGGTIVVP
ncbi:hypothetical protein QSJ18_05475 [Gordonia sp. ABSL1-1]|uniref:hypothetical protein n=1 Tax=Gordonia sp. ABSL1-1 TaxID=3053923 RepID=UPI002572DEAA|nr:hypothetical protein [Gordonia sp. ABSL1-1]MDL9936185.1 hypothetical protein [Gordonia sp. ABSL1-1]